MRIVTDYLDHSATVFHDKAAVVDQNRTVTFRQLKAEALHIASYIAGHFSRCHAPICFYLDKSAYCISVIMGIAYSGNFYTPIDTKMPAARIEKILETLENPLMITDKNICLRCRSLWGILMFFVWKTLWMSPIMNK